MANTVQRDPDNEPDPALPGTPSPAKYPPIPGPDRPKSPPKTHPDIDPDIPEHPGPPLSDPESPHGSRPF